MIKSIKVLRATVGTGILEPVQCSENLQIAINNSDHLTILDPKLPQLHQCLFNSLAKGLKSQTLDAGALYDVNTIFRVETLESLGFQIFSRLLIEDGEKQFNFGRISEPMIVGHKWSPINENTRDCYLGLLLNTGEVFVLSRDSLDATKYSVAFRSFTCLLDQMLLPQERLTSEGDIIISNSQFLELKVTDFEFGKCDGHLFVTLAHESHEISVHELSEGLPVLSRFACGGIVVKQALSTIKTRSSLAIVLNDNSVEYCQLNEGIVVSAPQKVKQPSRFLVSQARFSPSGSHLVITDTSRISFFHSGELVSLADLPYRSVIVSLPITESKGKVSAYVVYETGQMVVAELDKKKIALRASPMAWSSFFNKTLYKYQLLNAKEQSKAPSKVFLPFLTDTTEGNFYNFGTQLAPSNGAFVTVYSLSPKNVVHHDIRSRMEYTISMIPFSEFELGWKNASSSTSSTLSALNSLFIESSNSLPEITNAVIEGQADSIQQYIDSVTRWRSLLFPERALSVTGKSTLKESLVFNFQQNATICNLQKKYTLNVSLLRTFKALNSKTQLGALTNSIGELAEDQARISKLILTQISKIIIEHVLKHGDSEFTLDTDKYLLISFFLVSKTGSGAKIPQKARLTISTDICTESFEITKTDSIDEDFAKMAKSSSGHNWPRCNLSLVPILDLVNKSDELELHNYAKVHDLNSVLLKTLFETLGYCIYTGNRTFDIKIGI